MFKLTQAQITNVQNHNALLNKPAYIEPPTAHMLYPRHKSNDRRLMYLSEWKDGN